MRFRIAAILFASLAFIVPAVLGSSQGDRLKPQPPPVPVTPQVKTSTGVKVTPPPTAPELAGWADLHAHPASHLAFGAPNSGGTELFSGLPGLSRNADTLFADLPPCKGDHFWDDIDIVRSSLRTAARNGLEMGYPHGQNGAPTFSDWPHARSVIHQQMHITWVWRAYMGGQRLMVASVTDNNTLAMIWNRHQFATRPSADPNFDFESAKRQLAFIERWARANSAWMQIVTTPQEARNAIRANKMAIVLGVELDKLSTDQVLTLIRDYRVRQVIPIHLANNQFGGTAAYKEMFNTANHFLNGSFIKVTEDSDLRFRFKRPQYLRYAEVTEVGDFLSGLAAFLTLGTIGVGAMIPTPVDDATYAGLRYATTRGQRNAHPANETELKKIFRTGVMVDVAHMSQLAQVATLRISTAANYPVMNSHSGLRSGVADTERDMRTSDARTMARLGGVLGIGTTGDNDLAVIANEEPADKEKYVVRLTGSSREWLRNPRVPHVSSPATSYGWLRTTVSTGADDKRDNEGAWVVLVLKSGKRLEFLLVPRSEGLGGGSVITRTFQIKPAVRISDIAKVGVRHDTGSYFKDGLFRSEDNWDVAGLSVALLPDPVAAWTREAAHAMDVMGGKIAFGTDFNGLEVLVPGHASIRIPYPVNVVRRFAPGMRTAGAGPAPDLPQQIIGKRTLHFREDGLADYGMLADFLQSISQYPRGEEVVRALFRGAENVINLWEKSIAAKDNVR